MLLAGTETTSTALTWSLLLMIRYPHVQSQVQNELDSVIGKGRLPALDDRACLPFTEAVIQEVLRYCCIAPLGLPHFVSSDVTTVDGKYKIPKGTTIFANLCYIVNDPKVFPNPRQFDPNRFLNHDGIYVKHDQNIVFGTGMYRHDF